MTNSALTKPASAGRVGEFQEIAHCGGQVTFRVHSTEAGGHTIQFGIQMTRPNAAAWFGVYALPKGIPVSMIELGGIGQPWNPPPAPNCLPVFIASDSEGMFGHRCRNCRGYWRSNGVPARWPISCPYCGSRGSTHHFLTQGQVNYVSEYCRRVEEALKSPDGVYAIDMDKVADAAGKDVTKPRFYYAEERQQNRFSCKACAAVNDILGRYGYCSTCGTHNGLSELERDLTRIRERIAAGEDMESCVKDSVGAFDSVARQIAKQLAHAIPMTPRRKKEWKRRLFHNLGESRDQLRSVFDIDLFRNISIED